MATVVDEKRVPKVRHDKTLTQIGQKSPYRSQGFLRDARSAPRRQRPICASRPSLFDQTRNTRNSPLTLKSDLVPPQTLHSLLEKLITACSLSKHIVLFPLDRDLVRLEDLLDTVGDLFTDTITGDEGYGVFACLSASFALASRFHVFGERDQIWRRGDQRQDVPPNLDGS